MDTNCLSSLELPWVRALQKLATVFILLLPLWLSAQSSLASDLETEPNNTVEQADEIKDGVPIDGALGSADDTDIFAFEITSPIALMLQLSKQTRDIRYIYYTMFDEAGNTYAGGSVYNDGETTKFIGLEDPGIYYISVSGNGSFNASTDEYEVTVQFFDFSGTVESESNDTLATADPIPIQNGFISGHLHSSDDNDVFSFDQTIINHPGFTTYAIIDVNKYISDLRYLRYVVVDQDQVIYGGGTVYNNGRERKVIGIPSSGTYYVAVGGTDSFNTSLNEYTVAVERYYSTYFAVELEPNQTTLQSNYIYTQEPTYGHLYSSEDTDVYEMLIEADSKVELNIEKSFSDLRYINFELRNSAGDLISGGQVFNNSKITKLIGISEGGTYFLSILPRGFNTSTTRYVVEADYKDLSDIDQDGVVAHKDNCIKFANPDQVDTDHDGRGNVCDVDDDNDGVNDTDDAFPLDASEDKDTDNDGVGDNSDNCPTEANPNQIDTDNDGKGNACDGDDDNDGTPDDEDAFPLDYSEDTDSDRDGIGNNADTDDDNDGVEDNLDDFPTDPNEVLDTDRDGIGNNADEDDDGDGVVDTADDFPLDKTESKDTDNDGVGNNTDKDDDNDGFTDEAELAAGSDPLDPESTPASGIDSGLPIWLKYLLTRDKPQLSTN